MVHPGRSPSPWVFGIYGCTEMLTSSGKELLTMTSIYNADRKQQNFFAIAIKGKVQAEKHLQAISWQKPPTG